MRLFASALSRNRSSSIFGLLTGCAIASVILTTSDEKPPPLSGGGRDHDSSTNDRLWRCSTADAAGQGRGIVAGERQRAVERTGGDRIHGDRECLAGARCDRGAGRSNREDAVRLSGERCAGDDQILTAGRGRVQNRDRSGAGRG